MILEALSPFYPALATLGATLAAYLVGSLSFAVIVSRLMGLNDPRTYGSKNPGATNVLRSGSKAAAVGGHLFKPLQFVRKGGDFAHDLVNDVLQVGVFR